MQHFGDGELNTQSPHVLRILVDADACPAAIKELIFRASARLQVEVILYANQSMRIPNTKLIELVMVPHGADVADDRIIEHLTKHDVVITGDIPLAARAVDKGAVAIGVRGELYDDAQVQGRLASRNLMEQLRSAGMETAGPKPLNPKDVQAFANQLDRILTRRLRAK